MDWNEYTSKKALGRAKMAAPTQVLIMFAEVYSNKRGGGERGGYLNVRGTHSFGDECR